MRPRRHTSLLILAAAVAILPSLALAYPQPPPRDGTPAQAAARLPRSAEIIVVVDNAAELRTSDAWKALEPLLWRLVPGDAAGEAAVTPHSAWAALAKALGWTVDETFDRLLGTRVVFVLRSAPGATPERPAAWALLCDATPDTDRRLRERLRAAPRGIVNDHQVLAIENGPYELTTHRNTDSRKKAPDRVTLILGPTDNPELFDEMIAVVAGGGGAPDPLQHAPAIAALERQPQAEILFLARIDSTAERPADPVGPVEPMATGNPWDNFIAISCRREAPAVVATRSSPDDAGAASAGASTGRDATGVVQGEVARAGSGGGGGGWTADIIVRDRGSADALRSIAPTSDAAFRALTDGALAAIVETRIAQSSADPDVPAPVLSPGSSNPLTRLLAQLGVPADVGATLGSRQVLVARPAAAAPGIALALALDTTDGRIMTRGADEFMARTIGAIEQTLSADPSPVPDFHALAPEAVRVLPIDVSGTTAAAALLGSPPGAPIASWCTFDSADTAATPTRPRPAWWVLALAPADRADDPTAPDLVRAVGRALTTPAAPASDAAPLPPLRQWLSQGIVRPAAIEAALPPTLPGAATWRPLLRRITAVTWSLSVTHEGDITGTAHLDLASE